MKKTKKFISWLIAAAIICNTGSLSFAAAKRDVNDPVLREIINELSKKMPKFIDKYGETVFVEDEPITRGALLSAIYEYDRRTKSLAPEAAVAATSTGVSQISRQEFDSLRAKVTTLEKSGTSSKSSAKATGGNVDMVALIADLEPNMPMLLDNSLNNSRVFKALQQQIASGKTSSANINYASTKDVTDINSKIDLLTKRVTTAETNLVSGAKAASKDTASYTAVNKDITDITSKLELLSKRLGSAETNIASASGVNKNSKIQPSSSSISQKEIDELKNSLNQIQQSYVKLAKRVDELNDRSMLAAVPAARKQSSDADMSYINRQLSDIKKTVASVPTSTEVKNEINRSKNQTQADIERIERRLNNISASSSSKQTSSSSDSSNGRSSGATIATISLGITMIAALFVAR